MIKIANEQFAVTINEKGAELQSIQLNGFEYLWQANEAYWGKHAPVLFPIIGTLKDGKYIFENKEYKLSRHGFARDKMFDVKQTSDVSAVFTLSDDDESFAVYPFKFIFKIEYKISNTVLLCTYSAENITEQNMYFSVGGHPAFKLPLSNNLQYTDYVLKFNDDNVLTRYLLHDGLTSDDTETINLDEKKLHLKQSLFYADAIVLKHINSNKVKLYSDKDARALTFNFEGFPYFGIWAAKDAPFVCLEPWCGITDNIHHYHQLENKEGINKLTANETWQRTWSVQFA